MLPFRPMSPFRVDKLPEGPEWIYQLKWDGYRLIASIDNGEVRLFTKNMLPATGTFPEIADAFGSLGSMSDKGTLLLDGEAVVMDPATGRPSFQKLQQRSRWLRPGLDRETIARLPVQYIVFDVLQIGGEDLRRLPFEERNRRLRELAADWRAPLFTTDTFDDGASLWEWVERNGWEGVVCKRRRSSYREGKTHRGDWLKRKTAPEFDVDIIGITWKEGRVSSLVMRENGVYFGRVSSGLNGALKEKLRLLGDADPSRCPFSSVPAGMKGIQVRWLQNPIAARVIGSEVTEEGVLRHPKLLMLDV